LGEAPREPVPPYERIADHFRQRIRSGELADGARLPSIREVAAEWGVARQTAAKVMASLRSEGLVRSSHGGTVVDLGLHQDVTVVVDLDDADAVTVTSVDVVTLSTEAAREFHVDPGRSVVVLHLRVR
jgi:DNA-binding GntR family transcriptional regulator